MRWSLPLFLLVACGSPPPDETVVENSPVIINELSSSVDDPIELVNRSTAAVDLTGWFLQDEDQSAEKTYTFPSGRVIEAGAFLVLRKGTDHGFGLSKEDKLYLYDADGNLADAAGYELEQAVVSFCRRPSITGEFGPCPVASFGAANPP